MSDAPETALEGGAPTPAEADMPDGTREDDFTADEVTEATPPDADEGEEAPEAN